MFVNLSSNADPYPAFLLLVKVSGYSITTMNIPFFEGLHPYYKVRIAETFEELGFEREDLMDSRSDLLCIHFWEILRRKPDRFKPVWKFVRNLAGTLYSEENPTRIWLSNSLGQ